MQLQHACPPSPSARLLTLPKHSLFVVQYCACASLLPTAAVFSLPSLFPCRGGPRRWLAGSILLFLSSIHTVPPTCLSLLAVQGCKNMGSLQRRAALLVPSPPFSLRRGSRRRAVCSTAWLPSCLPLLAPCSLCRGQQKRAGSQDMGPSSCQFTRLLCRGSRRWAVCSTWACPGRSSRSDSACAGCANSSCDNSSSSSSRSRPVAAPHCPLAVPGSCPTSLMTP